MKMNVQDAPTNFKWKKTIKRKLKEAGGELKVKKLRKAVKEEFLNAGLEDIDFETTFEEKLSKVGLFIRIFINRTYFQSGVAVEGKIISLSA